MATDNSRFEVREGRTNSAEAALLERSLSIEGEILAGPRDKQALLLFARDSQDGVVGGLRGDTVWRWLQIGQLWVRREQRRQGVGMLLMQTAERMAFERGCTHSWVDTFSFQAPDFYTRLGYEVFGSLNDFPQGHRRQFLWKRLDNIR